MGIWENTYLDRLHCSRCETHRDLFGVFMQVIADGFGILLGHRRHHIPPKLNGKRCVGFFGTLLDVYRPFCMQYAECGCYSLGHQFSLSWGVYTFGEVREDMGGGAMAVYGGDEGGD